MDWVNNLKLIKMVTAIDSLVKYETAILVSSAFVSKKGDGKTTKSAL